MTDFDQFSDDLLEQSKRFLENAKNCSNPEARNAYLNASLLISVSSLEAFINSIVDDFSESEQFTLNEKAFLQEKEIEIKNGEFLLSNRLKMSRLTERIEVLAAKFVRNVKYKKEAWWQLLKEGISIRNDIVHPKKNKSIEVEQVERTLMSIIHCVDFIFKSVYGKGFPSLNMGLQSKYDF
jgi:hypothetical protein